MGYSNTRDTCTNIKPQENPRFYLLSKNLYFEVQYSMWLCRVSGFKTRTVHIYCTPQCNSYVSLLYKMNNIFYLVKMLSVMPQSMEEDREEQTTQVVKITRKKIRRKPRERTTQLNQLKELIIQAIHIQNIPFPSHYLTFGTVLRNNWLSLN